MLLAKPVSPAVRRLQETVWDDAALSARFDGIDAAMTHSSAEGSSGDPICNKWLVLDSLVAEYLEVGNLCMVACCSM